MPYRMFKYNFKVKGPNGPHMIVKIQMSRSKVIMVRPAYSKAAEIPVQLLELLQQEVPPSLSTVTG